MKRVMRHILLSLALLVTQHAVQMHALSHLGHDLAFAQHGQKGTPPVGHPIEKCIAFQALGSALSSTSAAYAPACGALPTVAQFIVPLPFPPRIVFDSRAPPALS